MSMRDRLRSTPVKLAVTLVAALTAGLVALGLWIASDVSRALASRTQAAVDADLAMYKTLASKHGLDALETALAARPGTQADRAALYLLTHGVTLRATSVEPGFTRPPAGGAVFNYKAHDASPDSGPRLAYGRTIDLGGTTFLTLARDIEDERAVARRLQRSLLLGIAALTLAGLVGGIALGRALDNRLARINNATAAIVSGDLTRRIDRDRSGDEFDRLSANLNDMLARIDGLMTALREVSDNIAHDLKTPINRLRNTAEAAFREAPETQREALGAVIEQADGIIQTFNALLQIARLEHGASDLAHEPVDLGALATDVVELYEPVAEDKNLIIRYLDPPLGPMPYTGNRELLGQALANLLDNAIKYSSDTTKSYQGAVDVEVLATETGYDLRVTDRGPGIAADDRDKAVKRFGRLDASRSLPGTGLGLSLVAAIARLHGGRLTLGDNTPGLIATLSLPHARKS